MNVLLRRGDRVKHEFQTDWGLGEVLDDQSNNRVRERVASSINIQNECNESRLSK